MTKTQLRSLVREEIKKTLNEGFKRYDPKHQKAAMLLSEFIKTKIAPYMNSSDCAELMHFMASSIDKNHGYDKGLEYYSSVKSGMSNQ